MHSMEWDHYLNKESDERLIEINLNSNKMVGYHGLLICWILFFKDNGGVFFMNIYSDSYVSPVSVESCLVIILLLDALSPPCDK